MLTTLIILAVALVLAILVLTFRVQVLTSVLKGRYREIAGPGNNVNGFLFIAFYVVGLYALWHSFTAASVHFLPQASSEHGVRTDQLFWVTMTILLIAFLATNTLLYVFPYIYRYRADRKAKFYRDNHLLEIVWTVIPAIIMAVLVAFGWIIWDDITNPKNRKANAEVIEIMGKQFAWQVRYPGMDGKLGKFNYRLIDFKNEFGVDFKDSASYDDFMPSKLYMAKGRPVLLKIRARDVLHSVFLPHFRVKMDAVPGMPTSFYFTPTKSTQDMIGETGNANFKYELACTEICGRGHYAMRYEVIVLEADEYDKWKAEQKTFSEQNAAYVAGLRGSIPSLIPVAPAAKVEAVDSTQTNTVVADTTKKLSSL
jgi:cytochrome c oxidase subunit II